MTRIPRVVLTLSLLVWAAGCAEPPTAQVEAAKARVAGLADEAALYAADAYAAAEAAVERLDAEMAAQDASFALTRSYDQAIQLASAVEAAAGNVEQAIAAEQQRLQAETDQIAADAARAMTAAQEAIAEIPAGDRPEDDTAVWERDLAEAESAIAEAERLLAGDQLAEAHRAAETAQAAAARVAAAVSALEAELEAERAAAAERAARGDVTLPRRAMLDGTAVPAGTYRLRLAEQAPAPAGEEDGPIGRWVELVRDDDTVAGRGIAVVIPDAEIAEVADSAPPRNETRVVQLADNQYIRIWLHRDGVSYLLHLGIS